MEIIPLGDSALIVRLDAKFERDPEEALRCVLETQKRLQMAALPGVVECAPGYESVAVFFDPVRVASMGAPTGEIVEWLQERIRTALARAVAGVGDRGGRRVIEIPVCYDGEFAPDLEEVARHAGMTSAEVIRAHSAPKYRVHCLGFTPGFPYLSGLPPELATPRRVTPRQEVPAGAVAIGGAQTGIYPQRSPGGWNVIGRTSLRLFDAQRDPPTLLETGDRVRFRPIARGNFE